MGAAIGGDAVSTVEVEGDKIEYGYGGHQSEAQMALQVYHNSNHILIIYTLNI